MFDLHETQKDIYFEMEEVANRIIIFVVAMVRVSGGNL